MIDIIYEMEPGYALRVIKDYDDWKDHREECRYMSE